MSGGTLPPVAAPVLAEALDALPGRLRKRLDDMVARAAGWPAAADGAQVTVQVDEAVTVTLAVRDGAVRSGDAARCSCLLAPNCLHRAAVLARAPGAEDTPAPAGPPPAGPAPAGPAAGPAPAGAAAGAAPPGAPSPPGAGEEPLTPAQRAAAGELWRAGAAVLAAGVTASGAVLRAAVLRAAHEARANGLHRAAAAGRRVAARLQAAREAQPQYRLADLSDDLRELLAVTRRLRDPALPAGAAGRLVGTGRRDYGAQGSLRLYGLCAVPVVAESGHAGVVTYLADRDGRLWTVANLAGGGADRAAMAGDAAVALGEATVSQRALGRAGLVVSGATASAAGQLGAGRSVRAVRAGGARWTEEPLARLWAEPLADQVRRAFAALALPVQDRPAGSDLLFLPVRVLGGASGVVHVLGPDGAALTLTVASDHAALADRDNLQLLGACAGVDLLLVARPDPARRATVQALAVGPAAPAAGGAPGPRLALPDAWAGHADLGYDRLHRSHLPARDDGERAAAPARATPTGDPSLQVLRRHLERAVSGGRAVQALAASDRARLRRARLETGAALLEALTTSARARPRDAFGRLADDGGQPFAEAWLALAVYEQAASRALAEASWLPGVVGEPAAEAAGR
ncbi:MAG TPA: hypothetical protein VKG45_17060 [Actinomycetes bacterium]|nr:hypothetical protein [Actinomycetes bacterium]